MNTRILFLEELNRLRHDILAMAVRVEENLGKALTALRNNDTDLAKEVKADDAVVDAMQLKIEDEAAILIATQQPVARDLRELVTIFKITGNLERSGDHAVHGLAILIFADSLYYESNLKNLRDAAETMVSILPPRVLESYFEGDGDGSAWLERLEGSGPYRITLIRPDGAVIADSRLDSELAGSGIS